MTVRIDPPAWAAHGRDWSHLISDSSEAELHAFAAAQGIPRSRFEGDHYDIPQERYQQMVAAGAVPTPPRELVRRLQASGLRLRKRKGEKGIARLQGIERGDGVIVDVDLIAATLPAPAHRVFAAIVFLRDRDGLFAAVRSVRRREWGSPGGRVEGEESPVAAAVREVAEETGIELEPASLLPCGYERHQRHGEGRSERDLLQVYRCSLPSAAPPMRAREADTDVREWVTPEEFQARCQRLLWWPLAVAVFDELAPS